MERTMALLGGVLPLQLVPLEHMMVGWTGDDSPEVQATFGSPSMPSQVTQEQPEIGALGPKQMTLLSSEGGQMP